MSAEQPTVEYRDVPGLLGYRVGDDGSIWSRWKKVGLGPLRGSCTVLGETWRSLKPVRQRNGRFHITLRPNSQQRAVHRLVLEAFVGPCPEGMECLHGDGKPANNRLNNLRWGTKKENGEDKVRHGNCVRGERFWSTKTNPEAVRQMRNRHAAGESTAQLAVEYGLSWTNVKDIIKRRIWKHVDPVPDAQN